MNRYVVRARRTYACILDRQSGEVFFRRRDVALVRSACRDLNASARARNARHWVYDPKGPWPSHLADYPEGLRDPGRRRDA